MTAPPLPPQRGAAGYSWQHIRALAWCHQHNLLAGHGIAMLAVLATVPIPMLMPLLVDEVLLHQPGWMTATLDAIAPQSWHGPIFYILAIFAITVLLRVAGLLLNVWQNRQFARISKDIVYHIRADIIHHLRWVSMAEYETLGSGKVNAHLITDLDTLDQFIGSGLSKLLVSTLTIVGIALVLVWLHWQLALAILLLNPALIYLTSQLGQVVKRLKSKENQAYEDFQALLQETLDSIQQIRASNREDYFLDRVLRGAQHIREHSVEYAWKTEAANRFSLNVFILGTDSFRLLGMFMVLFSGLSVGEMFAISGYLWVMSAPIQEILAVQYNFHSAKAALTRINELFTLRREPPRTGAANPFAGHHTAAIRLENLTFAYPNHVGGTVLDQVSLDIAAGEKVALVGASGGGKTTLAQILLGLYTPDAGQVYYNGMAMRDIDLDKVRENVGAVLQHPALFNDTLRMNLNLGREWADDALWRALAVAQLQPSDFPAGLDTVLGRHGVRLSGGQRQRVAIARMILTDPKVVILDEATSALDMETESQLHQSLRAFLAGKTTLIIAHRPSAVRQADRILVFDQGRFIQHGSHAQLCNEPGVYARLYGTN